ncbi:uncharacterized protein BCR38DRAFT_432703 [Pseudomassariella vexata]|uniref:Uncharacterized protein n=1 Tax=Pseudomassariella vexata TaxID=1141098 RepID=A0A1Y2E1I2_9PEZI|nr:uncharacterized protein BCR38DRAFT_432703 [Pseudomassariella vexata]ORY65408.1 hypothetical protein BCR38DRAFT_432703 [Pseudomassariella vexata]
MRWKQPHVDTSRVNRATETESDRFQNSNGIHSITSRADRPIEPILMKKPLGNEPTVEKKTLAWICRVA